MNATTLERPSDLAVTDAKKTAPREVHYLRNGFTLCGLEPADFTDGEVWMRTEDYPPPANNPMCSQCVDRCAMLHEVKR